MAVPDYQSLMLPLLRRVGEQSEPVALRGTMESIAAEFHLTDEERAERLPSGPNLLSNRLAWARTYLLKAGLIASPRRGHLMITPEGAALLSRSPSTIDVKTLRAYPAFLDWIGSPRERGDIASIVGEVSGPPLDAAIFPDLTTPHERISQAVSEIEAALRSDLIERVRLMTPAAFEDAILRLLLAMGYGRGISELAQAIGGTADGGMDGVIHQDPLGLDRVYIQAKRYKEGNNVSSPDIRNFVGALNIHRASKGVFVTASQFTSEARAAANGATVQVVLIDGARLTELMVRYNVGVLSRNSLELKELDDGFFDA